RANGAFHEHVDALVDTAVLERANHLQAGTVAHVRQPRIGVTTEVALENTPVLGAVENRPPFLELAYPGGGLLGMQLSHAPLVEKGAAAHRIAEMNLPAIESIGAGKGGGDPAFSHHGVRLAQERFAHQGRLRAAGGRFYCCPEPCSACAHDEYVVLVLLVLIHVVK